MLTFNRLLRIAIGVFKINFFEGRQSNNYGEYYYSRDPIKQMSEIAFGAGVLPVAHIGIKYKNFF